jgi:hypothetical protein
VQPGHTIYETSISIKEGPTLTATLHSVQTLTTATCSIPVGPVSAPSALTLTRTLPGETYTSFVTSSCTPHGPSKPLATITVTHRPSKPTDTITVTHSSPGSTFTSFHTAPGFNNSVVRTSIITRTITGPTIVHTAPGDQTTLTEYRTTTLPGSTFTAPGGKHTLTEYATLPGSIITSIINHPGENSTTTTTETTTCYETVSTCSATPYGPVSPPHETTIYTTEYLTKSLPTTYTAHQTCSDSTVTDYITKTLPTTYTAYETCSDSTVTVTASSTGWDESGGYGDHRGSHSGGDWGDKPSGYGDGAASSTGGSWRRV